MSLSDPFIRRPVFSMMLTASAIVFGVLAYLQMPVDELPTIPSPVISVNVGYPGASPETMANNVATPLEKQFLQIPGIKEITSSSSQGQTTLNLEFVLTKSIDAAATDVQTAITQATGQLPADLPSPPTFQKTNPNDQPIIYIALTSQTLTLGQLYEMANTQIGQRISIIEGVSNVRVFGAPPAVRVEVDPSALASRGMSMQNLADAISAGTQYQGVGQFDGKSRSFLLTPQGQLSTADDYRQLIVAYSVGRPVYLKDVATVIEATNNSRLYARFLFKGAPENSQTVVLAVTKQAGANTVEIAKTIRDMLPQLNDLLPGSAKLAIIFDRSLTIVDSLNDVKETLAIAFVLVILVIFVFLGSVSATLIPVVAMPLSLLMTFIVMKFFGFSIDNLSLLALVLAVGFLVDDAIVFLENVVRRMEAGENAMRATFNGASEISFTILSMTLSLAAVFLPLVFMPGQVGVIFREFGATIIISVVCSGIVSLTLTPLMCSRALSERKHGEKKPWMERFTNKYFGKITNAYVNSLGFFLRNSWISILAWVASMVVTVYLFTILPRTFLPSGDSGFIRGVFVAEEGTSPDKMKALQDKVTDVISNNPNLAVGVTVSGFSGFLPSNLGGAFLFLKPRAERPPIDAVIGELTGALFSIPGVIPILQANPVLQIATGATANQRGKYAFAISGLDSGVVYATAEKMIPRMMQIPGIATVNSDMSLNTPQLQINMLRDQASSYGVSVKDIENVLRNAYSQNYMYLIKTPVDQYQLIMETNAESRANPQDLSLLYVRASSGVLVPLSAVCQWVEVLGPQNVNHINQFTSVTIFFNLIPGVAIGDVTSQIDKIASEEIPTGLISGLKGDADIFAQLFETFPILLIFALFAMYVILGILYESYLHPLTVLTTLFPATVGGMLALWLFNQEFSLYAMIGMFLLLGIVKKNGIMIVDFALQQMDTGKSPREAVEEACRERFRPIIMTTLAAVMGALPLAIGIGAGGGTRVGLGITVVGGLLISQVLTLYVTPVSFLIFEWVQEHVFNKTSFLKSSRVAAEGVKIEKDEPQKSNA